MAVNELAAEFLREYSDPEIDKRLHFDVWSDRCGFDERVKRMVWREVSRVARREAGRKRWAERGRCTADAAAACEILPANLWSR